MWLFAWKHIKKYFANTRYYIYFSILTTYFISQCCLLLQSPALCLWCLLHWLFSLWWLSLVWLLRLCRFFQVHTTSDLLRVITCDTMTFNTQNATFYIIFQQWTKNSILPGTRWRFKKKKSKLHLLKKLRIDHLWLWCCVINNNNHFKVFKYPREATKVSAEQHWRCWRRWSKQHIECEWAGNYYHGSLYHAAALWCLETFCLKSLTCFILFSFSYIAANQNNGHLKLGCKLGATFSLNEKVAHLRYIYFTRAAYCIAPCWPRKDALL